MVTSLRFLSLTMLALTLAMSTQAVARNVPYVAAFAPLNSSAQPYSGNMKLNFNHGTISGTYTDTSLKPGGPLYNRRDIPVSGGVNSSGHATLLIGPLSFHGTLSGQWFSGSATVNGRIYTFKARQGSPGNPAP